MSPWWYRRRPLLILVIYLIGFYAGWWLWYRATGDSAYAPSYVWIARGVHVSSRTVLWIGTAFAFAGWAARLWGSAYLSTAVVWNRDALQGALFVDGPFRFVRNPLYLGNDLQAFGIGLLASPIGLGIIVIGNIVFTAALAAHEATGMRARYGAAYDAYCRAVPAIVPRLFPARVGGAARGRPTLGAGLRAEFLTTSFALGMLAYTLTSSLWALWVLIAIGWIAQAFARAQTPSTSAA